MRYWLLGVLWLLGLSTAEAARPHERITIVQTSENVGATAQTDNVLMTPATGRRLVLMGGTVCTGGAVDVELEESDVDVFFLESLNGCTGIGTGTIPVYVSSTTDDTFDWSTGAATTTSINCWGYDFTP